MESSQKPEGGIPGHAADPAGPAPPLETAPATPAHAPGKAAPAPPPRQNPKARLKTAIIIGISPVLLAGAGYVGVPWVVLALTTVSTDDAYVNGHYTIVAPRVDGQVKEVLTDDNKRVKAGEEIVLLDPEPYQDIVNVKEASLAQARVNLDSVTAQVQGLIFQARTNRFRLETAQQNVRTQVAQLKGAVAALDAELAIRSQTLSDYNRYKELIKTKGATTQQELDLKEQNFLVAKFKVRKALEDANQIRAGLGLATIDLDPDALTRAPPALSESPPQLDETFSTVRQAATDLLQSAAQIGIYPSSYDLLPSQILAEFLRRDPEKKKNIDRILREAVEKSPQIADARAKVDLAQRELDVAKLNLSYCVVKAEIDGVVTRRNVNKGNNVKAGQAIMVIRSLTEIWIDCNFKETQLRYLRIGQRVKIEVDMYGSHKEFEGRITGFTMGTGQTLSLLPPQNATGNFVKIVQRLPVKVELFGYDEEVRKKSPLFYGLSVTPYVYFEDKLVGNDPGKGDFLQPLMMKGGLTK